MSPCDTGCFAWVSQLTQKYSKSHSGVVVGADTYDVTSIVKEGSHSTIYRCRYQERNKSYNHNQEYALKKTILTRDDNDILETAIQEAILLKEIQVSDYIIKYITHSISYRDDSTESKCHVYLVSELSEMSLCLLVNDIQNKGENLREGQILKIVGDVITGIAVLHSAGPCPIAHRNVRVENVLFSEKTNTWKLCDLGSASTQSVLCQTREQIRKEEIILHAISSLHYRPPECCDLWSRTRISELVDIWSLGILICYLYTFEFPFTTSFQILSMDFECPPSASSKMVKLITSALATVATRADIFLISELMAEIDSSGHTRVLKPNNLKPQQEKYPQM